MAVNLDKLEDPNTTLGAKAHALVKRLLDGEEWDDVVSSAPLMMFSRDFREFVARQAGRDPDSGKLLAEQLQVPPAPEPAPESEEPESVEPPPEPEDAAADEGVIEQEAAEEAEEPVEDAPPPNRQTCHWCGVNPVAEKFSIYDANGDLVRHDQLCDDCAAAYWAALHLVQRSRMWEPEG